ncbi:MAG: DNA-processing protein DprA [Spirochaetales bacterium]
MKELLALSVGSVPGLRFPERLSLFASLKGIDDFRSLKPIDLAERFHRVPRNTVWSPTALLESAEKSLRSMEKRGIRLLTPLDPFYPPQLKEIYDPPFLLFYRGFLPTWEETFLAIVGTRKPTGAGRTAAYTLAKEASRLGMVIVSGLARGIDGEAHKGCLDSQGKTVAVLGHGLDTVYPVCNRSLGERILRAGGIFFSEYPPGTPPKPYHFPARNRIISGLSRGVVVVEAPYGSGALITADYAMEQGRDLMIHRVGAESVHSTGTERLREDGAPVIESCQDLLTLWGFLNIQPTEVVPGESSKVMARGMDPGQWLARQLREELERKR